MKLTRRAFLTGLVALPCVGAIASILPKAGLDEASTVSLVAFPQFRVGDLIQNKSTGELMRVRFVDHNGRSIAAIRGVNGTCCDSLDNEGFDNLGPLLKETA